MESWGGDDGLRSLESSSSSSGCVRVLVCGARVCVCVVRVCAVRVCAVRVCAVRVCAVRVCACIYLLGHVVYMYASLHLLKFYESVG